MATTPTIRTGITGLNSNTTSLTTGTPGNTDAGDLMLCVGMSRGATISPPAGWTTGADITQGGLRMVVMFKVLDAADIAANSYTFTSSSGSPQWSLLKMGWRDAIASYGLFRQSSNLDGTGRAYPTSLDAPSILGHTTCELVCFYQWRNGPSFSPASSTGPSGMTRIISTGFNNDTASNSLLYEAWRLDLSANAATGTESLTSISASGVSFVEGIGLAFLLVGTGTTFGSGWNVGRIAMN